MPSYEISGTAEKFAQVIAALEDIREDLVGEGGTDAQLYKAWLKGVHTEVVVKHKRRVAQGTVAPDPDIVEIT
jgi:hypothetical protein